MADPVWVLSWDDTVQNGFAVCADEHAYYKKACAVLLEYLPMASTDEVDGRLRKLIASEDYKAAYLLFLESGPYEDLYFHDPNVTFGVDNPITPLRAEDIEVNNGKA